MKRGSFRLAKQTGSSAHFAQVAVEVTAGVASEFSVKTASTAIRGWHDPVRLGVEEALRMLKELGEEQPMRVCVTEFIGMPTDTSDDDARVAALLATLSAVLEQEQMPVVQYMKETDSWSLRWLNSHTAH